MQVVADADEGESLFEEFADAGGAEQKEAEDDIIFAGVLDQLFRGGVEFGRGVHVRELVLVVEAHRHAEIVLAEEENIDAGNSSDLSDVLDARGGLDLQRDDAFVVPGSSVAE